MYPILAELFKKLSDNTQVLLTTHSSENFLSMFDIENIPCAEEEDKHIKSFKPSTSHALIDNPSAELEIRARRMQPIRGEFEMIGK